MALHGSTGSWFLLGGYELGSLIKALVDKVSPAIEDTTGLGGDGFDKTAPTGSVKATLSQSGGFFDTAAGASHEALKDLPTSAQAAARIACYGRAGMTIGQPFTGIDGVYVNEYEVLNESEKLHKANPAYTVDGEPERGVILQPLVAEAVSWDTEAAGVDYAADPSQQIIPIVSSSVANPSVIVTTVPHGIANGQRVLIAGHSGSTPDITGEHVATLIDPTSFSIPVNVTVGGTGGTLTQANSLAGAVGFLQVTDVSGWDGLVCRILDSADDIVYVELLVFPNVTARASHRVTVAGTVDRHTAMDGVYSGAGPGTSTPFCGIKRN